MMIYTFKGNIWSEFDIWEGGVGEGAFDGLWLVVVDDHLGDGVELESMVMEEYPLLIFLRIDLL